MTQFTQLSKSALFTNLPVSAQSIILSKTDLDCACKELQVQLDIHFASIQAKVKTDVLAGQDIDALKIIGKEGADPFELNTEDYQKLVELDPARYHPSSLRPTTKIKASFNKFLNNL